jgi:YVTN family beta-propeller protein
MMLNRSANAGTSRKSLAAFLRVLTLSLLTAALGFSPLHAQMVVYVANFNSNTVSVIDTASNNVTATIPVGRFPVGVAVAPDGKLVYVSSFFEGTISVIDTSTNTVTNIFSLGARSNPTMLAITPDGNNLYVVDQSRLTVSVVSTATGSVVATVPVNDASAVAITPDGSRVYVQGVSSSFSPVDVIDTATNTVIASIPVPGIVSFGIADTPNGRNIYVTGGFTANVSVISTSTNTVTATISDPGRPEGIAISPDGSRAYVTNLENPAATGNQVDVIDTTTNTVVGSIPVGAVPEALAVTPDGAFVYVKNAGSGTVSVIDTSTNTVIAVVQTEPPQGTSVPLIPPAGAVAIANMSAPFAAFKIDNLNISPQGFHEQGDFTLGANSGGVDLAHQPVTLTIGSFSLTIPAGSFRQVGGNIHFVLNSTINGLQINCNLKANHKSSTDFSYTCNVNGVDLTGQPDPVTVGLKIGHNSGTTAAEF